MSEVAESFGEWCRRMVEKHHNEYVLLLVFGLGLVFTLHVSHDGGSDKELVSFGREITFGALTCLYGFLKGIDHGKYQALTALNLSGKGNG